MLKKTDQDQSYKPWVSIFDRIRKTKYVLALVIISIVSLLFALKWDPKFAAAQNTLPEGKSAAALVIALSAITAALILALGRTITYLSSAPPTSFSISLRKYADKIESVEDRVAAIDERTKILTPDERQGLVDELTKRIRDASTDQLLEELQTKAGKELEQENATRTLRIRMTRSVDRLTGEIDALQKRAITNLVTGMALSSAGILALIVQLFLVPAHSITPWEFFVHYSPRFALVVLVEIFAYFFLRLYKKNLDDIKYYQNEITNIEAKQLALLSVIMTKENSLLADIVSQLGKTERNFIIEKGQSTIELERDRLERETASDALKMTTDALSKAFGTATSSWKPRGGRSK